MRRALASILLLAAVACIGPKLPTSVRLTPSDLPEVVLQVSDVPAGVQGLEFRQRQSGPEDLDRFGRPGEQQGILAANGFAGAYRVSLSTDAYVDHPSEVRYWTGVDLVEHQIVVLKDAGAAKKILEYYRELTLRPDQSPDMKSVAAPNLGEQAYGLTGLVVRHAPAYIFYWRRGNVFSALTLVGTEEGIAAEPTLAMARAIDQRIRARA